MKRPLFFILSIAFCIALPAQPYTSKDFKDVKVKFRNATVCGSNDKVQYLPFQNSSQHVPRSYYDVGKTHYMQVTYANARNTTNWSPDGKTCAATWTMGSSPTSGSGILGTGINYYDYDGWGEIPTLNPLDRIEQFPLDKTRAPGWGSQVFTEEGECVVSHSTADSGMVINYREIRREGEWTQYILKGPELSNGKTEIICPSIYAVGNTIHLVCVTGCAEGATYHGYPLCPLYYRSTDGGQTWEDVRTFEGVMTELDMRGMSADQYVLTARENHVVLAYVNGYAAYLESFDGGDTWERHLVYDTDWSWESTGVWVGPTMYATTIAVAIGDDEKVHIAFSAQMRHREPDDEPDSLTYYPTLCALYTWNDEQPIMTHKDLKLEYDYNTQTWISLGYDLLPNFMEAPIIFGSKRFRWWADPRETLIANFNNVGYISHPRLIAEKGKVYLMYSSIIEEPLTHPSNAQFIRGVFVTVSNDNGATYDQYDNTSWISYGPNFFYYDWEGVDPEHPLETAPDPIVISESGYPSMTATIAGGMLVFTWLSDLLQFPDTFADDYSPWQNFSYSVIGFRLPAWEAGIYNNTRYQGPPPPPPYVDEKILNVNLKVSPNPADNIVTVQAGTSNPYTLTITNFMGQLVQTIKGQQPQVELNVANYPAGIYIVNVKTAYATASQKLIVK